MKYFNCQFAPICNASLYVNLPLYVTRPYFAPKCNAPLYVRTTICQFVLICKAPLYASMFGKLTLTEPTRSQGKTSKVVLSFKYVFDFLSTQKRPM